MFGRIAIVGPMVLICLASGTASNGMASVLARSELAARGAAKVRKVETAQRVGIVGGATRIVTAASGRRPVAA